MLTLELNRSLHFGTGIAASNIASPSSHLPYRLAGPYGRNEVFCFLGKLEAYAPSPKFLGGQHAFARLSASGGQHRVNAPLRSIPEDIEKCELFPLFPGAFFRYLGARRSKLAHICVDMEGSNIVKISLT